MKNIQRLLIFGLINTIVNQNAFASPVEVRPSSIVSKVSSITDGANVPTVKTDGVQGVLSGDKPTGGKSQPIVDGVDVAGVKTDGVLGGGKTAGPQDKKSIVNGVNVAGVKTDGVLGGDKTGGPQDKKAIVEGVNVAGVKPSEVLSTDGSDGAKNGQVVSGVDVGNIKPGVLGGSTSKNKSKKNLPCAEVAGVNVDTDKTIGGVANTKGVLGDTSVVGTKECTDAERAAEKLGKAEDAAE